MLNEVQMSRFCLVHLDFNLKIIYLSIYLWGLGGAFLTEICKTTSPCHVGLNQLTENKRGGEKMQKVAVKTFD